LREALGGGYDAGTMARRIPSQLTFATGFLCLTLCPTPFDTSVHADPLPIATQPTSSGKRWVTFDVAGSNRSGDVQLGQPLELSIALGGVTQGLAPLVAICESTDFQLQVVRLTPDSASSVIKATTILEPTPQSQRTGRPEVARIRIVFAKAAEKKFEWVMTRIVYVTLERQRRESAGTPNDPPLLHHDELSGGGPAMEHAEPQPDAIPVAGGHVVEEDLMPIRSAKHAQAYWRHVSELVGQSWSRTVRRVPHSPKSETLLVQFRLYPGGRAQMIQIEEESGTSEVDEAGIHAIVQAQPFPPFPKDVESEPIDVHVRMKTGQKVGVQDTRTVVNPQAPNSASRSPKTKH
jgi:TonB family protein